MKRPIVYHLVVVAVPPGQFAGYMIELGEFSTAVLRRRLKEGIHLHRREMVGTIPRIPKMFPMLLDHHKNNKTPRVDGKVKALTYNT